MAEVQRKLTNEESLDQTRLAVIEQLRACVQGGNPRGKEFKENKELAQALTAMTHEIGADKNRVISLLGMLNPKIRESIVKNILADMLPHHKKLLLGG